MLDVVASQPKPYGEDLIEDVFSAIEANPAWRKEYDDLRYHLGKGTVNAWGGFWIAHAANRIEGEHVSASRSTLIDSYSKLVKAPKSALRKVKEPEALQLMSRHFFANRESLPAAVREQRSLIVELIKEGFAPAEAFTRALEKPAMAK